MGKNARESLWYFMIDGLLNTLLYSEGLGCKGGTFYFYGEGRGYSLEGMERGGNFGVVVMDFVGGQCLSSLGCP